MEKRKPQRVSTINKAILTTLATVFIIVALLVTLLANTVFTSRLDIAKERDAEQAEQIVGWVRHSFSNVVNLLSLTAHSLAELNYDSGEADAAAASILLAMMNFDSSVYDAWVIFEKDMFYPGLYHTREYIRYGEDIAEVSWVGEEDSLEDEVLEPWYAIPITTGEVYFDYVGLYDYGDEYGEMYTATISLPIVLNGKTIGVCGVDITYEDIFAPVEYLQNGQESLILLLGDDMAILHTSDGDFIDKNLDDFFSPPDIDRMLSSLESSDLDRGAPDQMYVNEIASPFSGEKSFISLQSVNVDIRGKNHPLYIYMETPVRILYAPGYRIMAIVVMGGLAGMVLIILAIFYNLNTFIRPIRSLTTYAQQITAGDSVDANYMETDFDDTMNDKNEINVLRCAFIKMVNTLNENLNKEEKCVEERTHELVLMTKEAEEAKERAEIANEIKSRFLANMSHNIRTPMNAVIGMSELLLSEKMNAPQHQRVEDIHTAAISLLDIINGILDLSKIQTNKLSLEPVHYNFSGLIDKLNSSAQFLAGTKNLAFKLNIQGEMPKCLYGDDIRLKQALLNILGNAVKFTDKGFVRLTVDITDTQIKFSVSDTGIGIRAEDIPTLFEAFTQAEMQKNRKKDGSGLSLAITKSLVEMMGGQITVESMYGHGATFNVIIPKIKGDEALIVLDDSDEDMIYAPDAKVLVVDDNAINLNVACGLLKLYHITAETASSGRQAVDLIKGNQYDLVFMDHMIPGMDGIEATKKIRSEGINTTIVALTANAIEGSRELYLAAGMDDFMTKPIDKALLVKTLQKWIPADKIKNAPAEIAAKAAVVDEITDFWKTIEQIEGLSIVTGLERIYGQRDVYKKTLRLTIKEIEKCDENLNEFLAVGDMHNFRIEVHGMKGSLANIGVMELSARAYELEKASANEDSAFCAANLPGFLETLRDLGSRLTEAFAKEKQNRGPIEIPPELPPIFEKLTAALDKNDFSAIDEAVESLDALNQGEALKDEIDKIKEAVMLMDNGGAIKVMQGLLK